MKRLAPARWIALIFAFALLLLSHHSHAATYFDFTGGNATTTYSKTWTGGGTLSNVLYRMGHPLSGGPIGPSYSKGYFEVSANLASGRSCSANFLILEGFSDSNYSSLDSADYFQVNYPFQTAGAGVATGTYSIFDSASTTLNASDWYELYLLCEGTGGPDIAALSSVGDGIDQGASGSTHEFTDNVVNGLPRFCLADSATGCPSGPFLATLPEQYESDATTTIAGGSATRENTVVFGANVNSTATSTVRLEIELQPAGTSFSNSYTSASGYVSPGTYATTSATGLSAGSYHWQARAVDNAGATSSWQLFGLSATSTDFTYSPVLPQFQVDTSGTLTADLVSYWPMEGSSTDVYGPNNGHDTNMQYGHTYGKVGQGAAPTFGGTGNGIDLYSNGSLIPTGDYSINAWVDLTGSGASASDFNIVFTLGDSGTYYERYSLYEYDGTWSFGTRNTSVALFRPQAASNGLNVWQMVTGVVSGNSVEFYLNGVSSTPVTFSGSRPTIAANSWILGGYAEGGTNSLQEHIDEVGFWDKALSEQEIKDLYNSGTGQTMAIGTSLGGLNQYHSDATTPIAENGTTTESTVTFGAHLYSSATSTEQLQVEVEPAGISFVNSSTVASVYISPGSYATATISGLANGDYHWQARVADNNGVTSTWQLFGPNSTSTDFTVKVPMSMYFSTTTNDGLAWPAAHIDFAATDPWTIEFWYRTPEPATSTTVAFIDTRSSSTLKGYYVGRDPNDGIHFVMICDSGAIDFNAATSLVNQNAGAADKNGIWHQVTITKSNATTTINAFHLYFDGEAQSFDNIQVSGPISGNCFSSSSTDTMWIGRDALSTSTWDSLAGNLEEVRISDLEKSSSSVLGTWDEEATSTTDLLGLWQFNGTSTEVKFGNSTSGQSGNPAFATSSPFGHFLLDQNVTSSKTAAHGGQILWYASSTGNSSNVDFAAAQWNSLGGATIASTTSSSSANLIVFDINGGDLSWTANWGYASPYSYPTSSLQFNTFFFSPYDAKNAAMHELGHALGLDHSYLGNVMNYYWTNQESLGEQDKSDYNYLKGQNIWGN